MDDEKSLYKPVIQYCGGIEIGGGLLVGSMLQLQPLAPINTPAMGRYPEEYWKLLQLEIQQKVVLLKASYKDSKAYGRFEVWRNKAT